MCNTRYCATKSEQRLTYEGLEPIVFKISLSRRRSAHGQPRLHMRILVRACAKGLKFVSLKTYYLTALLNYDIDFALKVGLVDSIFLSGICKTEKLFLRRQPEKYKLVLVKASNLFAYYLNLY